MTDGTPVHLDGASRTSLVRWRDGIHAGVGPPGGRVEDPAGARGPVTSRLRAGSRQAVLTVAEASQVTGKSRRTINRLLSAGRLDGADRDEHGAWCIPRGALLAAGLVPPSPSESAWAPTPGEAAEAPVPPRDPAEQGPSEREAALRAELTEWRRRAELAEARAAERATALDDMRAALRLLTPRPADPAEAFWAEIPENRRRRRWRRRR